MTERRPLVRIGGRNRQLPVGDTIAGSPGAIFGEPRMLATRNSASGGVIYADGQLISNALAQYPAAVANVRSASPTVPVTTPATWLADPFSRASWAYDVAADQLRVPDYNGKQAGSIGPVMFRGDGTLGFAPGKIRQDQIQGHAHVENISPATTNANANAPTTTYAAGAASSGLGIRQTNGTGRNEIAIGEPIANGENGTPRTGTETFPTHAVIIWGVVLFGSVSNPGAADAAVLAASYANQQARLQALEEKRFRWQKVSDIPLSANAPFSANHTLGFLPQFMTMSYRCITADAGYAVGDVVYLEDLRYQANAVSMRGSAVKELTATSISGSIAGTGIAIVNKTTNSAVTMTFANWVLVITLGGTNE